MPDNSNIRRIVNEICDENEGWPTSGDWAAVSPLLRDAVDLLEAAQQVLAILVHDGNFGPATPTADDKVYPRDERGRPWYRDVWALKQVIDKITADPLDAALEACDGELELLEPND